MNKRFIVFSVLCLAGILFISGNSYSQGFNSVTTPDGTNLVAVGDAGQLYRSASGGVTWTSVPNGALDMNGSGSLGNDVWIAADNGTTYKTGKTASAVNTYTVGGSEDLFSINFIDANTGYTCGDNGAVYKTINGGINWNSSNSGIGSENLSSIDFRDANNGRTVGTGGIVYVTSNGGSSWTSETSGTSYNLTGIKHFGTYAVATGEYGVILYNSSGTWNTVTTRTTSDITGVSGTSSNDVHVCGGGGFIRNNKSGSSNYFNFEINPMMANLVDIFYYDANNGWAVSSLNNVIIYTTNGGTSWSMPSGATLSRNWTQKLSAGGGIGNNLSTHPTDRNSLFCVMGSTVYVSRNKGETWSNIATVSGGGSAHSFYVSPLDTNVWLCAITSNPDRVTRTTNYGATWTTSIGANFSNYGQPLEMDQNNPSVYYFAPDNDGFYKSTDDGVSFTKISTTINGGTGGVNFRSPCDIIVKWDDSNIIMVGDGVTGSGQAQFFLSKDGGVTWDDKLSASASEIPSMCNTVFDNNIMWGTEWSGSTIYKTTNGGDNWASSHSTGFSGWASGYCLEDPSVIYTGNYGSNSSLTTNAGTNWLIGASGMSGAGAGAIVPERGYIISQQTSNVYKMNFNYSYSPVVEQIDVEVVSVGDVGTVYYPTVTIIPSGTVGNNNGAGGASFTVTRTITPGSYSSTKTINLGAASTTAVNFDPWTFNAGTLYTVKDSVYILNDGNTSNDVKTGTLTPFVGSFSVSMQQDFSSGTFPPSGWSRSGGGTQYWKRDATVTGYGTSGGSSYYDFWSANTGTAYQYLSGPSFAPITTAGSLVYDYAYAPYNSSSKDSITIEYSTNNGSSYSTLVELYGFDGATGDYAMNTRGVSGNEFVPDTDEWETKQWSLPVGTNRIRFRAKSGYGNNFYLDNIKIQSGQAYTQLNLVLAPQAMYNGATLNSSDTVTAYLRNTSSPYNIVDTATAFLNGKSITAACVFQNITTGNYFIQVDHRNSVDSWSQSGGHSITMGMTSNYDFTSAQSKTYGSNSVLVNSKYCFYSGDVNKDGIIDIADQSDIDNDASNFISGYVVTDLNGDDIVDLADAVFADNNGFNFITAITP